MRHRTRLVATLGAVTTAALLLAGCSGGSGASPTSSAAQKDTITIGVPAVAQTLDQAVYPGESSRWAHIMYGEGLLTYAPLPADAKSLQTPSADAVQPALAESYTVGPDSVQMTLRDAVSPAGNHLTADDVKWTFDREIALADSTGLFYLKTAGLDTTNPVEVIDPHTVVFHGTLTPLVLVSFLADQFAIIDSTLAKQHATTDDPWAKTWLTTNSAGFGPYSVSAFQPNTQLTLVRNENYWGTKPAYATVIETPATTQTAAQLLQSGTVDYLIGVPLLQFSSLASDPNVKTYLGPGLSQDVLELSQSFAPFQDANVRRAMSMAINRSALVQGPYQGTGTPATSVVSSQIPNIGGQSDYYTYNIDQAKKLMAQSAYPNGFDLTLTATQAEVSSVDVNALSVALVSQLAPLGINVKVQTIASDPDLRAAAKANQLNAWLRVETPAVADADYLFNLIHVTGASSNFTGESNPQFDALVKQASTQAFGADRDNTLTQAAQIWNDQMYDVPLVQVQKTYAFASDVCGFGPDSYQQVRVQNLYTC